MPLSEKCVVIGDVIRYTARYSTKASHRFMLGNDGQYALRPEWPIVRWGADCSPRRAIVTGVAVRAMREWKAPEYIGYEDGWTAPQWKGETVLLCREHLRGREFIVRFQDAEMEGSYDTDLHD